MPSLTASNASALAADKKKSLPAAAVKSAVADMDVSNTSANAAGTAAQQPESPLVQVLQVVEKKARNLEKRKVSETGKRFNVV